MRKRVRNLSAGVLAASSALLLAVTTAQPIEPAQHKRGPGRTLYIANCGFCHGNTWSSIAPRAR